MRSTIVALLIALALSSCSSHRRWIDRNAELEFEVAYGNPGNVEVIKNQVQFYDDGLLIYRCERKIRMKQLSSEQITQLRHIIQDPKAIESLKQESKKPLKEVAHVHFNLKTPDGMEHLWVYIDGMPASIQSYLDHLETFFKEQFPQTYEPVQEYAKRQLTGG